MGIMVKDRVRRGHAVDADRKKQSRSLLTLTLTLSHGYRRDHAVMDAVTRNSSQLALAASQPTSQSASQPAQPTQTGSQPGSQPPVSQPACQWER